MEFQDITKDTKVTAGSFLQHKKDRQIYRVLKYLGNQDYQITPYTNTKEKRRAYSLAGILLYATRETLKDKFLIDSTGAGNGILLKS